MLNPSVDGAFYSSPGNLTFSRITRYISQTCPFLIACTQVTILSWFAQSTSSKTESDEDGDEEDTFYLNTTTVINQAFNQEMCESLHGSIDHSID